MKINYIILLLIFICVEFSYAQERFFIFTNGWRSEKVIEYDSHFLSIGLGSTAPYQNHIEFTKLNKQGDYLEDWTFKLDSTSSTEFVNSQTINGVDAENMVIGTTTIYSSDPWTSTATQLKFNNGFTEYLNDSWFYNSSYNCPTQFRAGLSENDNNIIYATIGSFNSTLNLITSKADFNGNVVWEQSYSCGIDCLMEPRHVVPAYDGGYLFISDEDRDIWQSYDHTISTLIKTDSSGVQEWRIYPGGTGLPFTAEHLLVIPVDDGNYLCAWTNNYYRNGLSYSTNPNATIVFAKITPDGDKLWEKNIQQEIDLWEIDEVATDLTQIIRLSDGNIALTSYDKIIKITQDADVIWARRIKPDSLSTPAPNDIDSELYLLGITETSDGGFICAGEANVYPGVISPNYIQSGFVVKVDEYGCLEPDCHLNDPVPIESPTLDIAKMLLFPNPAKEYITLQYDVLQSYQQLSLSIIDLAGRQIYSKALVQSDYQVVISTSQFPAGQYFCNLKADEQVVSRKFVVVK